MLADLSVTHHAPLTARRMAEAAVAFLDALNPGQRAAATFKFDGYERYVWNYRPTERNGLRLINMTREQQSLALALMATGLSDRGAETVQQIMALEPILLEHERLEGRVNPWVRHEELYWFSVFGQPWGEQPWAWRVGGHHVGLHYTIIDREHVATLPIFFGANPAEVKIGPRAGLRTLPNEEDLARALLQSLDDDQKRVAVVSAVAPSDILTDAYRSADRRVPPTGLPLSAMRGEQRERFVELIRYYVNRVHDELAANEWRRIEAAGLDGATFAWAGPEQKWQGHYYAIKGPTFLIEYDNTQNGANHIHSVLRDWTNDWGEDLLARHYAESHRS